MTGAALRTDPPVADCAEEEEGAGRLTVMEIRIEKQQNAVADPWLPSSPLSDRFWTDCYMR